MDIDYLERILELYRSYQKIIEEVENNKHFCNRKIYVFSANEYEKEKIKDATPLSTSQTEAIYELAKAKKKRIEELVENMNK